MERILRPSGERATEGVLPGCQRPQAMSLRLIPHKVCKIPKAGARIMVLALFLWVRSADPCEQAPLGMCHLQGFAKKASLSKSARTTGYFTISFQHNIHSILYCILISISYRGKELNVSVEASQHSRQYPSSCCRLMKLRLLISLIMAALPLLFFLPITSQLYQREETYLGDNGYKALHSCL